MRDLHIQKRNTKGQYAPKLDYYKYITLGIILFAVALFVNFDVKIVDQKPLEVHAQTIENITSPQITTKPQTIEEKICKAFTTNCSIALKIAKCESNLDPHAIGDRGIDPHSYGLFQIRAYKPNSPFRFRPLPEQLLDIDINIATAVKISNNGTNWNPWTCYSLIK